MNVKEPLSQIGLEANEIDIYLALVQVGKASAGQLSKKSGVPRTYAYKILEELIEKGFVQTSSSDSIRRYSITDYDAPKRYLERKELEMYKAQQEAQSLSRQLENLANPQVATASSHQLNDQAGLEELWKLLHSTLTREIWVISPPIWWGDSSHSLQAKKWEQYRQRQHIWEKRFSHAESFHEEQKYTENYPLKTKLESQASLFLVDNFQVQVTCWEPFRALRIDSQEMVELMKSTLIPNS